MKVLVIKDEIIHFVENTVCPHRLSKSVILLCMQGQMSFDLNLDSYDIHENELVLLFPCSLIQVKNISPDFRGILILSSSGHDAINMDIVKKSLSYLKTWAENSILPMSPENMKLVIKYADLIELINDREDSDSDSIESLMTSMFLEIMKLYKKSTVPKAAEKSRSVQIFKDLVRMVLNNYKEHKEVSFYANQLCITPKHLTTTIKSLTNKTVSDIIASAVILDAKMQLKSSSDTVQQISNDLKFPNPSFFGKYFKKHTGMSPNKYRMQEQLR